MDLDSVRRRGLGVVLSLLFAAGWAANHFTAMIPELARVERLSSQTLSAAFGVYAVGLLPGLLGGGALSDRVGRRVLVLPGAAVAGLGNLAMLFWHDAAGIWSGRFVVGLGVGLVVSAGTAWAGDLGGARGTTLAGVSLTGGFACGPFISGFTAQFLAAPASVWVPFAVTVGLSAAATVVGLTSVAEPRASSRSSVAAQRRPGSLPLALAAALPMSLWVFSTVATAMVVLANRLPGNISGPWVPGLAALLALGSGLLIQVIARHRGWGPAAGVVGAVLALIGFGVSAATGASPNFPTFLACCLLMGCAYGLCLRDGLVDVGLLAPPERRGIAVGLFYVGAYLGFGLPLLLDTLRPRVGSVTPLLVLAGLAALAALARAGQIRSR